MYVLQSLEFLMDAWQLFHACDNYTLEQKCRDKEKSVFKWKPLLEFTWFPPEFIGFLTFVLTNISCWKTLKEKRLKE